MDWIKCSDRMPEQYIAALNRAMTWDDGDFFDDIQNITHWQPLPEPPTT